MQFQHFILCWLTLSRLLLSGFLCCSLRTQRQNHVKQSLANDTENHKALPFFFFFFLIWYQYTSLITTNLSHIQCEWRRNILLTCCSIIIKKIQTLWASYVLKDSYLKSFHEAKTAKCIQTVLSYSKNIILKLCLKKKGVKQEKQTSKLPSFSSAFSIAWGL